MLFKGAWRDTAPLWQSVRSWMFCCPLAAQNRSNSLHQPTKVRVGSSSAGEIHTMDEADQAQGAPGMN